MMLEQSKSGEPVHPHSVELPREDIRVAAFFDRCVEVRNRDNGRGPECEELREYAQHTLFPDTYSEGLAQKGITVDRVYSSGNLKKLEITALLARDAEKREVCVHYRKGESLEIRVGKRDAISPRTHFVPDTARFEEVAAQVKELSETAFEA